MHDEATLESYVVVNAETGKRTTVTGHRVGDFAVRFAEVMSVATPDGRFVVHDVWVVDHLPTGASTTMHDEKTAWFVADELAVHLDGVEDRKELFDRSRRMRPWIEDAVLGKSVVSYRTWLREQEANR